MKRIKDSIYWVGKVDWEVRKFHGTEYSTHRGTSYNAYLIRDEKTVLIDTVWDIFGVQFVENLKKGIDLDRIDFIIANHAELDHSGALAELMKHIPDTPIYCTPNAVKSLKGHFHRDWNFVPVKTGDTLSLGKRNLIFIEAPMLHWPDSMLCYLTEDRVLFSNDAFGQHYATSRLYNDMVDQGELLQEGMKYYANILTPFSGLVEKKIKELKSLNLPLDMICPSHGVIWRKEPGLIIERYRAWSQDFQEDQITIVYDTMYNGTKAMAEAIAEGIGRADREVTVKLFNISRSDKNDVITEVFKSKCLLLGSPTINRGILSAAAGFLEEIRGLKFRNKRAAAFGTYGWSGESVKLIEEGLERAGFDLLTAGVRSLWNPDENILRQCVNLGEEIGNRTRQSPG